ncbi:hypothetical protein [Mycobacterium avium]
MARSVVAIDTTVFYASMCRLVDGNPRPLLGGVQTDPTEGRHTVAAEMRKHREFAADIVRRVTESAHGKPELVVLRKPEVGNVKADPSGVRRVGVHWELVRQLDDAHIPVAEVPIYTVQRALGLPVNDYGRLTARLTELYPDAAHPVLGDKPDPRYRMTTVGLALAGAVPTGIGVPVEVTDDLLVALRRGADFPFTAEQWGERVERLAGTRAAARLQDKRSRAAAWYEQQLEDIAHLPMAELVDRFGERGPRNATLKAAWRRRVEREAAR